MPFLLRKLSGNKRAEESIRTIPFPNCATPLIVTPEIRFPFKPDVYPYNTRYGGRFHFRKHYYPVIGELQSDGEEFECAKFIDDLGK